MKKTVMLVYVLVHDVIFGKHFFFVFWHFTSQEYTNSQALLAQERKSGAEIKNTFIFRQTWKFVSLFSQNRFSCHHMVSVYSNLQLGYLAICAYSVVEWNMRLHLPYLLCKFSCKKSTKRQNDHDREIGTSICKTPQLEKKQVQKKSVCTEF